MFDQIKKRFSLEIYNTGIVLKPLNEVLKNGLSAGDIHWVRHKYKDRFFADPFLYDEDESNYYILCEELLFWNEKGRITLLTVDKKSFELVSKRVVIEEPFHMSFPYCEFRGGYIIPEQSACGKSYRYDVDADMKVIEKTCISDSGLIDASFIDDEEGASWCYATTNNRPLSDMYVYKAENGKYVPVSSSPVFSNERTARSAGRFFKTGDNLFRPVQDCLGRYGRQTKIMKVKSFGKDGYEAEEVSSVNSFENPPFNESLHTFNVYENCIIVDGSSDFLRFPVKIIYKLVCMMHRH